MGVLMSEPGHPGISRRFNQGVIRIREKSEQAVERGQQHVRRPQKLKAWTPPLSRTFDQTRLHIAFQGFSEPSPWIASAISVCTLHARTKCAAFSICSAQPLTNYETLLYFPQLHG